MEARAGGGAAGPDNRTDAAQTDEAEIRSRRAAPGAPVAWRHDLILSFRHLIPDTVLIQIGLATGSETGIKTNRPTITAQVYRRVICWTRNMDPDPHGPV